MDIIKNGWEDMTREASWLWFFLKYMLVFELSVCLKVTENCNIPAAITTEWVECERLVFQLSYLIGNRQVFTLFLYVGEHLSLVLCSKMLHVRCDEAFLAYGLRWLLMNNGTSSINKSCSNSNCKNIVYIFSMDIRTVHRMIRFW